MPTKMRQQRNLKSVPRGGERVYVQPANSNYTGSPRAVQFNEPSNDCGPLVWTSVQTGIVVQWSNGNQRTTHPLDQFCRAEFKDSSDFINVNARNSIKYDQYDLYDFNKVNKIGSIRVRRWFTDGNLKHWRLNDVWINGTQVYAAKGL